MGVRRERIWASNKMVGCPDNNKSITKMNTTILPQDPEKEPNDAPKKFKNIDKEDFTFSWDSRPYTVKAGETVTYPKYLVNYAAMHLARKMHKRHMLEAYVPEKEERRHIEIQNANIRIVNAEHEMALQAEMVAANFQESTRPVEPPVQPETPKEPETPEVPKANFVCETCGFEAKSKLGLGSHMRKHK